MKSGRKAVLLNVFICLCLLGPAFGLSNKTEIPAPSTTTPLVSHTLIQEAGWTYNWQINLPLKTGETIDRLTVFADRVFAVTSTNMLFCVDCKTGRTRSLLQIGRPGLPVSHPTAYENKIGFIVGNEVMVFDISSGTITFRKKFPQIGNSQGALARNKTHLFLAGSDNRLHAINIDGFWQEFEASADNDSAIMSLAATDTLVVFTTQAGNVIGMSAARPKKEWQFDATGGIQGQVVLDDQSVYFGSEDSKLYKLSLTRGTLQWPTPFHSGGPIRNGLVIGQQVVYLYNDLNGLYGVDKETGKAIWQVSSGKAMICETESKAYVFAVPGLLKVMDNKTGRELYSMNFTEVTRTAQNRFSPVMYLGDASGRLMSVTVK
jgi:outer membrane protein assembly factor BamB